MGWDSSPRTIQSDCWHQGAGYPFTSIIEGNTPEAFREAMDWALQRVSAMPGHMDVLTINAWNEWTEGSYLEPDEVNGMAYLEAIRDAVTAVPQTRGK